MTAVDTAAAQPSEAWNKIRKEATALAPGQNLGDLFAAILEYTEAVLSVAPFPKQAAAAPVAQPSADGQSPRELNRYALWSKINDFACVWLHPESDQFKVARNDLIALIDELYPATAPVVQPADWREVPAVEAAHDLFHRMLEAPTTHIRASWKDAIRPVLLALISPARAAAPVAQPSAEPVRVCIHGELLTQRCDTCADPVWQAVLDDCRALGDAGRAKLAGAGEPIEPSAWRPEVVAFANAMERKLRANDWKGGWKEDHPDALMERVGDELREFRDQYGWCRGDTLTLSHIARPSQQYNETHAKLEVSRLMLLNEAADVANMMMMVCDVCDALRAGAGEQPSEAPASPLVYLPHHKVTIDLREVQLIEARGEYPDECTIQMRSGDRYSVGSGYQKTAKMSADHWAWRVAAAKAPPIPAPEAPGWVR